MLPRVWPWSEKSRPELSPPQKSAVVPGGQQACWLPSPAHVDGYPPPPDTWSESTLNRYRWLQPQSLDGLRCDSKANMHFSRSSEPGRDVTHSAAGKRSGSTPPPLASPIAPCRAP